MTLNNNDLMKTFHHHFMMWVSCHFSAITVQAWFTCLNFSITATKFEIIIRILNIIFSLNDLRGKKNPISIEMDETAEVLIFKLKSKWSERFSNEKLTLHPEGTIMKKRKKIYKFPTERANTMTTPATFHFSLFSSHIWVVLYWANWISQIWCHAAAALCAECWLAW